MNTEVRARAEITERGDAWLVALTDEIWAQHFAELKRKTPLVVRFGKRARTRLGSLSYDQRSKQAVLRVTGLFKDPEVPEMVIKATVVHELCHYAHGFHSGLKRKHKHPHAGGVIRQEFAERGLEELYLQQRDWLKKHWVSYLLKHYPELKHRYRGIRIRLT